MDKCNLKSPSVLVYVFVASFIVMLTYEFIKESLFKGTLTPWESHTITIIVTSIIATMSAAVIRRWAKNVYIKDSELKNKEKSLESFRLTLSAVNHIVNNVLNYLQLVKIQIDKEGKIPEKTLTALEESLHEANKQMKILNKIKSPSEPDSYKEIFPDQP